MVHLICTHGRERIRRMDADYAWDQFKSEFKKFFNHKAQVHLHKTTNKSITYSLGADPQAYSAAKLEVLRYIDPAMSDSKKVDNLLKGLPIPLQMQLATTQMRTPVEFVSQLRKIAELCQRNSITTLPSLPIPDKPYAASYYSSPLLAATHVHEPRPNRPSFDDRQVRQRRDNIGNCHYCHCIGHQRFECRNKRLDEQRGIFQPQRDYSAYLQRRQSNGNANNGPSHYPPRPGNYQHRQFQAYNGPNRYNPQFQPRSFLPHLRPPPVTNPSHNQPQPQGN